jgi:hypothetical protein
MVEVFKTNVNDPAHAKRLIDEIHKTFPDYMANFDLEDCDRILRIKTSSGTVQVSRLIDMLRHFGYQAEILPDEIPYIDPFHRRSALEKMLIFN